MTIRQMVPDPSVCPITGAEHVFDGDVLPGMTRCECGINRHYDRNTGTYWYSRSTK